MKSVKLQQLRCSRLPLAMLCPGAVHLPPDHVAIDTSDDASSTGTAVHAGIAMLIAGEMSHPEDIDTEGLAARYNAEAAQLPYLIGSAWRIWNELQKRLPQGRIMVEQAISAMLPGDVYLPGHADVLIDAGDTIVIIDWKSGWKDTDYTAQLAGYAYCAQQAYPNASRIITVIGWLRDQQAEVREWTPASLDGWVALAADKIVNWDGSYRPGAHCEYCPQAYTCEARRVVVRAAVADFAEDATISQMIATLRDLPEADIMAIYERATVVSKLAGLARQAIKEHIAANGAVKHDGHRLMLTETTTKTIAPIPAWDILTEAMTTEELAACMKISLPSVLSVIKANTANGKSKAAADFLARLQEANAIIESPTTKLTKVRDVATIE